MNPLIRVLIQNPASNIAAFGIGGGEFLIPLDRNAPIAIDIAIAEFQIKLLPARIVRDRGQHPRFHEYPVHAVYSYPNSLSSARAIQRDWPDAYKAYVPDPKDPEQALDFDKLLAEFNKLKPDVEALLTQLLTSLGGVLEPADPPNA